METTETKPTEVTLSTKTYAVLAAVMIIGMVVAITVASKLAQ